MKRINIDSKKIKVLTFTGDIPLLTQIATEEGVEFTHLTFPPTDTGELANDPAIKQAMASDIVFCDSSMGISFANLRRLIGKNAKIVACMSSGAEKQLTDDDAEVLSDIWLLPLFAVRARLRLRNLVNEIMEAWTATLRAVWLDTLMEIIPDMVWIKKIDGSHVKVNQAFCSACGKTRRMIEGRQHAYIWNVSPEEADGCKASEEQVIRSGNTGTFDEILKIGDKHRKLRTNKAPLRDPDGKIFGTIGVGNDITNLLNLDQELRIFVDAMPFPLLLVDDNGAITHKNARFLEFFGENDDDMNNTNYMAWKEWALEPAEGGSSTVESSDYALRDDPDGRMVQVTERDLIDVFGATFGHVCVFRDVTAERELQAQIWRNANVDSLTGLANRYAFNVFLQSLPALPNYLVYIDLDNFKIVNDMFGHKAGDDALKILANTIKECFPEDFAMRQGGDEFIICITRDLSRQEAEDEVSNLCTIVNGLFSRSAKYNEASISVGISSKGNSIEEMIKEADAAMYEFKKKSKQARAAATKE